MALRLTSGWTDRHTSVALLLLTTCAATTAGLVDGGWVPVVVSVAVMATVLTSLSLDAWGGAVVGLVASACVVAVRRSQDAWGPDDFGPAAVVAAALVAVGGTAGYVGRQLRETPGGGNDAPAPLWEPAYGSMGLLGQEGATLRLAEEVERASRTHRPLTVVLVDVEVVAQELSAEGRGAALRATARLVENRSREYDVPFALTPDRLGIVLPDSAAREAWDLVARILTSVGTATFIQGDDRAPRRLGDAVEVHAGIAQLRDGQNWEALLDEAATAVTRSRNDDGLAPVRTRKGDRS